MIVGGCSATANVSRWSIASYLAVETTSGIRALRNYPRRIASFAEARAIRGVGEKTAAKVRANTIRPLSRFSQTDY